MKQLYRILRSLWKTAFVGFRLPVFFVSFFVFLVFFSSEDVLAEKRAEKRAEEKSVQAWHKHFVVPKDSKVVRAPLLQAAGVSSLVYGGAAGLYSKTFVSQVGGASASGGFSSRQVMRLKPGWKMFSKMGKKAFLYIVGSGALLWHFQNRFFRSQAMFAGTRETLLVRDSEAVFAIKSQKPVSEDKRMHGLSQDQKSELSQKNPRNIMVPPLLDFQDSQSSTQNLEAKKHSSHGLSTEAKGLFEDFQSRELDMYYYDRNQPSLHSELYRLIVQYQKLRGSREIVNLVDSMIHSNGKKASLHHMQGVQGVRWNKEMLDKFVKTQIVSYKELHLYLRALLPKFAKFSSMQIASYYKESKVHLGMRSAFIVGLVRSFSPSALKSPRRIGPRAHKIYSIQQFQEIIENMDLSELHHRIERIQVGNSQKLTAKTIATLEKKHIFHFFESIKDKSSKNMFIQYLLKLSDIVPEVLAQEKTYAIELVSDRFYAFASNLEGFYQTAHTAHEGVYKRAKPVDISHEEYMTIFQEMSAKRLKKLLNHFRLHTSGLLSPKDMHFVKKEDVEDFMNQHLKTKALKDIFLALILRLNDTTVEMHALSRNVSVQDLVKQKMQITKSLDLFLAERIYKIVDSEKYLYLNELKEKYHSLSWQDLEKIFANKKTKEGASLVDLKYFHPQALDLFIRRHIKSSYEEHMFYNFLLSLDTAPVDHIAKIYNQESISVLKTKAHMFGKLVQAFETNSFLREDDEIVSFSARHLNLAELQRLFEKLYNDSPHYLLNQLKLHLMRHYGFLEDQLAAIVPSHIFEFAGDVLVTSSEKHMFLSYFLNLDASDMQNKASFYGVTLRATESIRDLVFKKWEHFSGVARSHKNLPDLFRHAAKSSFPQLSLEAKREIYKSVDMVYVVEALKNNLTKLLQDKRLSVEQKKQNSKAINALNAQHVSYFVENFLQDQHFLWDIFFVYFLGVEKLKAEDFAKRHSVRSAYVYRTKSRLKKRLVSIILNNHVEEYEKLNPYISRLASLEELWDLYHSLDFEIIASRLQVSLEKTYDASDIPKIQKKHVNFLVKDKLKTRLRQRVYLTGMLNLDDPQDYSIIEEYSSRSDLKHKVSNEKFMLKSILYHIVKQDFDGSAVLKESATPKITQKLKLAKKVYEELSDEDIFERVLNSYILKDIPQARDVLSFDIINHFIDNQLNATKFERSSQLYWHIFFCNVLKICQITHKELVEGYRLTAVSSLNSRIYEFQKFLVQLLSGASQEFQESIRGTGAERMLQSKEGLKRVQKKLTNPQSWYILGYLRTELVLPLETLQYRFFHLHDVEMQAIFAKMRNSDDSDDPVDMNRVDLFLHSAITSDLDWHIFFRMVLPYYKPSDASLRNANISGNHSEQKRGRRSQAISEEVIHQSEERIRARFDEVFALSASEANLALRELSTTTHRLGLASLASLRGIYRAMKHKEIIAALIDYLHKTFGVAYDVRVDSHEEILLGISHALRNHPLRWHIFLNSMVHLDKAKAMDIWKIYGSTRNQYFYHRGKVSDFINEVFVEHAES